MAAKGDPAGRSISALSGLRRRKKKSTKKSSTKKRATKSRRSSRKAKGNFCVYSPKGKLFNCFEKESSARKVVRGMSKRSKGWKLRKKGRS